MKIFYRCIGTIAVNIQTTHNYLIKLFFAEFIKMDSRMLNVIFVLKQMFPLV